MAPSLETAEGAVAEAVGAPLSEHKMPPTVAGRPRREQRRRASSSVSGFAGGCCRGDQTQLPGEPPPQRSSQQGGSRRPLSASSHRQQPHGGSGMKMRLLERRVLEALEKLESRDTVEQGAQTLRGIIEGLDPSSLGDLCWLLRSLFSDRVTPSRTWARREQLLLLPAVVQHFGRSTVTTSVLKERILPILIAALERAHDVGSSAAAAGGGVGARELQAQAQTQVVEVVGRVFGEIVQGLMVVEEGKNQEGFLEVSTAVFDTLLNPLDPGSGWDMAVKRRCILVLSALLPVLLRDAPVHGQDSRMDDHMENLGLRLMQGIMTVPGAQDGMLQCLAQLACSRPAALAAARAGGDGAMARRLVELCAGHLARTPSAVPSYSAASATEAASEAAEVAGWHASSPRKSGELTRELALMCCLCLQHLAEDVAPVLTHGLDFLSEHKEVVLAALSRDNLNLQRLVRSNELLRQAIARSWRAWQREEIGPPPGDAGSDRDGSPARSREREFSKVASMRELTGPLLRDPVSDLRPLRRCLSPGSRRSRLPPAGSGLESVRAARGGIKPLQDRGMPVHRRGPRPMSAGSHPSASSRGPPLAASSSRVAPSTNDEQRRDSTGGQERNEAVQQSPLSPRPMMSTSASQISLCRQGSCQALCHAEACHGSPSGGVETYADCAVGEALPPPQPYGAGSDESPASRRPSSSAGASAAGGGRVGAKHLVASAAAASPGAASEVEGSPRRLLSKGSAGASTQTADAADGETQTMAHWDRAEEAGGRPAASAETMGAQFGPAGPSGAGRLPPSAAGRVSEEVAGSRTSSKAHVFRNSGGPLPPPAQGAVPGVTPSAAVQPSSANAGQMPSTSGALPPHLVAREASGKLPPPVAQAQDETKQQQQQQQQQLQQLPRCPLEPSAGTVVGADGDWKLPHLAVALSSAASGRVDEAFRTVFRFGNEASLIGLLCRLERSAAWSLLPEAEARYLARLLVKLACKDPASGHGVVEVGSHLSTATEVCFWLEALAGLPGGAALLELEDLPSLRSALFSLSAAPGVAGRSAASAYHLIFEPNHGHCDELDEAFGLGCVPTLRSGGGFGGLLGVRG
mmetsp:Transcript_173485/g.550706  ORF Transcript_173485/g.550706 Transcript_173485/m.550706 type:complete len:1090 (+) Transcript_173485:272-3541(+)